MSRWLFPTTLSAALLLSAAGVHAQAVEGEVRKVDLAQARLTLAHGEIRSLDMPAMTMVFRVRDKAWLKDLAVGDKVRFDAEKVDGLYTVTALRKLP